MIGILLTILKVIGIIILILIALALIIVLTVLFIPVRYRGKICFKEVPDIDLSVTWFFKFLNISLKFKDELDISAKVAWFFTIFSNKEELQDENISAPDNRGGKDTSEKESSKKGLLQSTFYKKGDKLKEAKAEKFKSKDKTSDYAKAAELDKQEKKHSKAIRKAKNKKADKKSKSLPEKISDKIKDIHYIITNDDNKCIFAKMLEKIKKLIDHVLPKKIEGYFKFGFDDPSVTGQVLEIFAIFYPLYKDDFKIIPMFYDEIIEADISFKGRLRLIYAAYIGLILWLNKKKIRTRPK
ncbi:MAG: hypothetical protein ACFNVX_01815 [Lachnoanaerobaculum saburreum]